jgi:hypothetical protein
MKNKKTSLMEQEIETLIFMYWRDISLLIEDIKKKTAHMEMLFEKKLTPIFADDAPTAEWSAIIRHCNSIGVLKNLEQSVKNAQIRSRKKK